MHLSFILSADVDVKYFLICAIITAEQTCEDFGCDNGGTCNDGICHCPPTFKGDFCESAYICLQYGRF